MPSAGGRSRLGNHSAIFVRSEDQGWAAETTRDVYQQRPAAAGYGRITTEVVPAPEFCFAEAYHQQYVAKKSDGSGDCPNDSIGVMMPDIEVTPLRYVE